MVDVLTAPAVPSIVNRMTRRQFGLAGAAVLALSACGTDGRSDGGTGDEGAGGREVEHAMGKVTVPEQAERVVALDSLVLDTVVALGAPLVGAARAGSANSLPEYLGDGVEGVEAVGEIIAPNVEAIATLGPDLILGTKLRHEEFHEQLSAVAPTFFIAEPAIGWQDNVLLIGEALGRAERAEEVLGQMLAEAVDAGLAVGADGKTVHVLRRVDNGVRLHGPGTFSGSLLGEMGFTVPEKDWDSNDMVELSFENLDQIEADVVFVTDDVDLDDALLAGVPAVAAGNAYSVNDRVWIAGIGVLGAERIIADVREFLS
ncbi:iron-siderophore ABC transporter substrate-binding protein [Nocardiopsis exhalans]|uniref:Iron-siderophore ABC transporter substrate-binding protein n=1 Tax=Nocardiopsis exhalans TaxID=163604 RepID=A0ABY5DBR7_9ACTN|nr:iron-siderophore ABC transporter substrate-binding protein [Nocardiopsis exhalans]USY20830.1 iron-siderophore ABC transporter substrate-binding protein [Nocardiopsis exhalans]